MRAETRLRAVRSGQQAMLRMDQPQHPATRTTYTPPSSTLSLLHNHGVLRGSIKWVVS